MARAARQARWAPTSSSPASGEATVLVVDVPPRRQQTIGYHSIVAGAAPNFRYVIILKHDGGRSAPFDPTLSPTVTGIEKTAP